MALALRKMLTSLLVIGTGTDNRGGVNMFLTHQGWSQERGSFCEKYEIDTTRRDHEIHWKDGTICAQTSPFEAVEADWNCDGEVYVEFGANFASKYGSGREWHTPLGLLSLMLEGEAIIPGIKRIQ